MPLTPKAERILRDIFAVGSDRSLGIARRLRIPTPGPAELYSLCELLATEPGEEKLQLYLENNVGFLTSLLGTPDNTDLAVLFKPPVGTHFHADFCVLQSHQGGSVAHMIEIESSHEQIFTKKGRVAKRLAIALAQIEDWRRWINRNPVHYAKELVEHAQNTPLLTEQNNSCRGIRVTEAERVAQIWQAFGGTEEPFYSYTVLIGRWSQLSQKDKERLISRNRHGEEHVKIFTYEQVARLANFRLERDEWNNEMTQGWDNVANV